MTKIKVKIERVEEIEKDLKKLKKKFDTIDKDLERFEKALLVSLPQIPGAVPGHYREVEIRPDVKLYKAKHFRCMALKGRGCRSGIRVIYGFWPCLNQVTILEIYYEEKKKSDCDLERLQYYFGIKKQ